MSKSRPDILIKIHYNDKHPDDFVVMTNARVEALEELLTNWVLDCMFGKMAGLPSGAHVEREHYEVKIAYWLAGDGFSVESDTGDAGLTVGLALETMRLLSADQLTVVPLS